MKYLYEITNKYDEHIYPTSEWKESMEPLRCRCGALRAEHADMKLHADLEHDPDNQPLKGVLVPIVRMGMNLVRADLAEELQLVNERIPLHPATADGQSLASYHLMSKPFVARLMEFTKVVHGAEFCRACGRPLMFPDVNETPMIWRQSLMTIGVGNYFKARAVYFGFAGSSMFVTEEGLGRISKATLTDIRLVKCPVVDWGDCQHATV